MSLEPGKPTTASACATNACVEVTLVEGGADVIVVRDTKEDGEQFTVSLGDWRAFVANLTR